jgi:folate-binding protein YgfZ
MSTSDRAATDAETEAEYEALRTSSGVHILRRDVLSVSGPDTATYLQGQCSQDVEVLGVGDTAESLLLSPQGKIEAYLRISRVGDEAFVIDTDQGFGAVVTARLERFRLRMRVAIEPLDWTCAAWRGPDAPRDSTGVSGTAAARVVAPVEWPGLDGVDLLGPNPPGGLTDWVGDPPVRVGDEAWEASRIEAGVPVNGREIVEGSIAAEVGLVERTVSFTKGCFTGQELVARLDSRGSKVARHLCGVVIGDADDLGPSLVGASVLTADGDHEVGRLSSVARSPRSGSWVALATLHRRVEPPAPVLVTWTDADGPRHMAAESRPLPLVG